jgi:uncharacterized protein involved in tolerance to divalent cations
MDKKAKHSRQLPGETAEDFARFLVYRNLGPCRTLRKAYAIYLQELGDSEGGSKVARATRSWREKSAKFDWVNRATAWDAHNQQTYGTRIAVLQAHALLRLSKKAYQDVKRLKPSEATWKDVLATVKFLSKYITPELIAEVRAHAAEEAGECRICGRSG